MKQYIGIFIGFILAIAFSIFAFTEPTQAPPEGNVEAPLNVSAVAQSKAAGLIINTGGAATGLIVEFGNVGIGTVSPQTGLHVAGYNSTDISTLRIDGTDSAGPVIKIRDTRVDLSSDGNAWRVGSSYGDLGDFYVAQVMANGGNISRLLIDTAGNVGIGTTNPGQKLTVTGTIESTSGGFRFPDGTTQATAATSASTPNLQAVTNVGRTTSQNIQSPRFEDYDNSGYYLDPNSSSNLSGNVTASDFYSNAAGRWFTTLSSWLNQSVTTGASPTFSNVYISSFGTWLSSWLNQNVTTGANPTFNDLYLSTQGTWLSSRLNQSVRTDASPSFSNVIAGGQNVCRQDGTNCPGPSQDPGNRFGGLYSISTFSSSCWGTSTTCTPNPLTGGCSCPSGYSSATAYSHSVQCGEMYCGATCTNTLYQCYR